MIGFKYNLRDSAVKFYRTGKPFYLIAFSMMILLCQCQQPQVVPMADKMSMISCAGILPSRFGGVPGSNPEAPVGKNSHAGMVFIKGGEFLMGAGDEEGRNDEYPQHLVRLDSFWMDATEVTNAQFKKFIEATGYITTAEKTPDWDQIKKQAPPGTPKPPDSLLVASSLVFTPPGHPISLDNPSAWWTWKKGASWKHPGGQGTSIEGKDNYPVVQVSWEDAMAYCKWSGKRLPTEAEWEYATRGGLENKKYSWGNQEPESGKPKANTWQGSFPFQNTGWDGFDRVAPVASFPGNGFGLFDMAGNVWEWCSDWYDEDYYSTLAGKLSVDPTGPEKSRDPMEPYVPKKVVRGGSFLCNADYCKGYRASARMKTAPDTGMEHTGFRCVSSK